MNSKPVLLSPAAKLISQVAAAQSVNYGIADFVSGKRVPSDKFMEIYNANPKLFLTFANNRRLIFVDAMYPYYIHHAVRWSVLDEDDPFKSIAQKSCPIPTTSAIIPTIYDDRINKVVTVDDLGDILLDMFGWERHEGKTSGDYAIFNRIAWCPVHCRQIVMRVFVDKSTGKVAETLTGPIPDYDESHVEFTHRQEIINRAAREVVENHGYSRVLNIHDGARRSGTTHNYKVEVFGELFCVTVDDLGAYETQSFKHIPIDDSAYELADRLEPIKFLEDIAPPLYVREIPQHLRDAHTKNFDKLPTNLSRQFSEELWNSMSTAERRGFLVGIHSSRF